MVEAVSSTRLLKADEVAKLLQVGRSTVYYYCKTRKLPHIVIGNSVRIPEQALKAWLEQHTNYAVEK